MYSRGRNCTASRSPPGPTTSSATPDRRGGEERDLYRRDLLDPREQQKSLEVGACDYGMPNAMKIGGVTDWLRAASLAEPSGLPFTSHIFPEISTPFGRHPDGTPARVPRPRHARPQETREDRSRSRPLSRPKDGAPASSGTRTRWSTSSSNKRPRARPLPEKNGI